jgi:hypothetical protein
MASPRHCEGGLSSRGTEPAENLLWQGTLDDKSQFKPTISLFCEQAPSWVVMPTDTENLPRNYNKTDDRLLLAVDRAPRSRPTRAQRELTAMCALPAETGVTPSRHSATQ